MVYDDRHRSFLQAIMKGGAVLDADALALCTKIFNEPRMKVSIVADAINDKLSPLLMTMKPGRCELTGYTYWSVVGTIHEENIMMPSIFTIAQRAFLRTLYSEIIGSDDGSISSTDALNLVHKLDTKFSKENADAFVKTLVRKKWLFCKDGYFYIGVRSIIELMPYFRATFQDNFHNCQLCREVLFHGHKCENCDKTFHNYCIAVYLKQQQNKCPSCKHDINITEETGEVTQILITSQETNGLEDNEPMDVDEVQPRKSKKRVRNHEK